uniref:Uncharacterized protein n=1 Tax=Opuntia streptacantha TaxID=393608 RepID=A0A7C9A2B0_OPUST
MIPLNTPVQYLDQLTSQGVTHSESSPAEGRIVPVHRILLYTLARPSDVIHLTVIVLRKHRYQVVGKEHCIIISHHEPPHLPQPLLEPLLQNPGHPVRRLQSRNRRDPVRRGGFRPGNVGSGLLVEPDESPG